MAETGLSAVHNSCNRLLAAMMCGGLLCGAEVWRVFECLIGELRQHLLTSEYTFHTHAFKDFQDLFTSRCTWKHQREKKAVK
jgi:hypothetical protein